MGGVKKTFFVLISIIVLMNLYWFFLITRMNYRVLWTGVDKKKRERAMTDLSTDDDRSEVETESEMETENDEETEYYTNDNKKNK